MLEGLAADKVSILLESLAENKVLMLDKVLMLESLAANKVLESLAANKVLN